MSHHFNLADYSSLFNSASIIAGGIWAYFKFRRRNEIASISVKLQKAEIYNEESRKLIHIEALIENNGNREVNLYYNYQTGDHPAKNEKENKHYRAQMAIYKVGENEELTFVSKKIGLTSSEPHYTGRLRSNTSVRLPYIFELNKQGLYFIEFSVDINMKKYFSASDNDVPIKTWSDRMYFEVPHLI